MWLLAVTVYVQVQPLGEQNRYGLVEAVMINPPESPSSSLV